MSTHIRKLIEAMDEASKNELVRFAKHPFKPNGDKRVWPCSLANEYSASRERLKVAKRRFRSGDGSKGAVERNEHDLAEIVAHAKDYWLQARKCFPATIPKVNRRPVGQRRLDKPPAKNADSSSDGASKIERGKSVAAIALRTRQLQSLRLSSPNFSRQVAALIQAELDVVQGGSPALGSAIIEGPEDEATFERPNADAHVIARALWRQRLARKLRPDRSSQYSGWRSDHLVLHSSVGFAPLSGQGPKKKFSTSCEDRLCSAINPAAVRKFEPTADATEQVGFLFFYNPNRKRI